MKATLEFYRNIEKKKCTKCGIRMEEAAECYLAICDKCVPLKKVK